VEVVAVKPGFDMTISMLGIWEKTTTSKSRFRRWALDLPATACAVIYIVARISLLVLAVTSLRLMPGSVYETVDWTNYIPHLWHKPCFFIDLYQEKHIRNARARRNQATARPYS
jgi:hypothetical protein